MNRRKIIASILSCANQLDNEGYLEAADDLTRIAQNFFDEENPHISAEEEGYRGNDQEKEQHRLLEELGLIDPMSIDTEEDSGLDSLLPPKPKGLDVEKFKRSLSDGGADIFGDDADAAMKFGDNNQNFDFPPRTDGAW